MRIRMTGRFLVFGLLCGGTAMVPQSVFAQGNSLFSGSGTTKGGTGGISGTLGGSGFGSMTGGTSGASSSSGLGGAGGLGGLSGAAGGANGGTGFGANGLGGNSGAGGFVGRTGTTMAGNAQAGQAGGNSRSNSRGGATQLRGGSNNNQTNQNNSNNGGGANTKSSSIRPRQRIAFDFNARSPAVVATTVSTRLERIGVKNPALKNVGIQVVGGDVVLSGRVKTRDQSKLAENLLRLEPGVKTIRNELEIEQVSIIE